MTRPRPAVLEFVLEREPGSGSIQFSAYGYIAPTRRLCVCISIEIREINKIDGDRSKIFLDVRDIGSTPHYRTMFTLAD